MARGTRLTTVETVREAGSWLFTVRDEYGQADEFVLVPCEDGVEAWRNRCTHESQRFDTGRGVALRDGEMICPRHGSTFDTCTGECDNGEAAGTTLPVADTAVADGSVYLVDDDVSFERAGGVDDSDPGGDGDADDGPSSTSHIGF